MNTTLLLPSSYKYWSPIVSCLQSIIFKDLNDVEVFFKKVSPATNITGLLRWLSTCSVSERDFFLAKGLTQIKKQLVELRSNFPNGNISYLDAGIGGSLTLNRSQVGSILALSFVNLLPNRNHFPSCNMDRLLKYGDSEKLKCILQYFATLGALPLAERRSCITITRRTLKPEALYSKFSAEALKVNPLPMKPITIMPDKFGIEDAEGTLQVDFANMFIGGGVLGRGSLQEEILFLMQPECLVSLVVCERMAPNEAIIIAGTRRYSTYSGYGRSFAWKSQYTKALPSKTPTGQYKTCIISIDAIKGGTQGRSDLLMREFGKAFAGFSVENEQIGFNSSTISTGKWGCGYFNGDALIKLLVQWIAATLAGREMLFFPYDKPEIAAKLQQVVEQLASMRVSEVYDLLLKTVSSSQPPYLNEMLSLLKTKQPFSQKKADSKSDDWMVDDDPRATWSTKVQSNNSSALSTKKICLSPPSPFKLKMKIDVPNSQSHVSQSSVKVKLEGNIDGKKQVARTPISRKRSSTSVQSTLTNFGFTKRKM